MMMRPDRTRRIREDRRIPGFSYLVPQQETFARLAAVLRLLDLLSSSGPSCECFRGAAIPLAQLRGDGDE
jgi:hypothetical protein